MGVYMYTLYKRFIKKALQSCLLTPTDGRYLTQRFDTDRKCQMLEKENVSTCTEYQSEYLKKHLCRSGEMKKFNEIL